MLLIPTLYILFFCKGMTSASNQVLVYSHIAPALLINKVFRSILLIHFVMVKIFVLCLFCWISLIEQNNAESCSESTSCDNNGCKTVRNCDYNKGSSSSSSSSSSGKNSHTKTTHCTNGNCTICENGKCRTEIQKGGSKQGSSSSSVSESDSGGRKSESSSSSSEEFDENFSIKKKRSV